MIDQATGKGHEKETVADRDGGRHRHDASLPGQRARGAGLPIVPRWRWTRQRVPDAEIDDDPPLVAAGGAGYGRREGLYPTSRQRNAETLGSVTGVPDRLPPRQDDLGEGWSGDAVWLGASRSCWTAPRPTTTLYAEIKNAGRGAAMKNYATITTRPIR